MIHILDWRSPRLVGCQARDTQFRAGGWEKAGRRVGTLWWTGELTGERSDFPSCSESAQKEARAHMPRTNSLAVRPSLHPRVGLMPRLLASSVVGGRLLWEAEEGSTLAPGAVHLLPSAALGSTAGQGCKLAFRLHQRALKPGSYSQGIPSQAMLPSLAQPQPELIRVPLKPFLLNFTP